MEPQETLKMNFLWLLFDIKDRPSLLRPYQRRYLQE